MSSNGMAGRNQITKSGTAIATQSSVSMTAKQLGLVHAVSGVPPNRAITGKDIRNMAGELLKLRKKLATAQKKKSNEEVQIIQEVDDLDPVFIKNMELFEKIIRQAIDVYAAFPFGGKEHHYQAALEEELRESGEQVYQELATNMSYRKKNGDTIHLPHDIRGREDLNLPKQKLIVELKQTGKLTDKEHNQTARYMEERRQNSSWGPDTKGMLINFGDNELECWALFYSRPEGSIRNPAHMQIPRLTRVLMYKEKRPLISTFVDSFQYLVNKS